MAPPTVRLYGLDLGRFRLQEAAEWLIGRAREGLRTDVSALNAGKVVEMERSPVLRSALAGADLLIPDGQSIVWAARLLGEDVPERVAGVDLMAELLARAAREALPVYLLGARDDVVRRAALVMQGRFPGLVVAGARHGYFEEADEAGLVREIAESGARLLFLGITSPKKELFVDRNRDALSGVVTVGVGGSFDVVAGVTRRAPRWAQRTGLEWAFRFAQEPRRLWRRYLLGNLRFAAITRRELAAHRAGRRR